MIVERGILFMLLVQWSRVERHTAFRESELFGRWRAAVGEFFAVPPDVEHFAPVV